LERIHNLEDDIIRLVGGQLEVQRLEGLETKESARVAGAGGRGGGPVMQPKPRAKGRLLHNGNVVQAKKASSNTNESAWDAGSGVSAGGAEGGVPGSRGEPGGGHPPREVCRTADLSVRPAAAGQHARRAARWSF